MREVSGHLKMVTVVQEKERGWEVATSFRFGGFMNERVTLPNRGNRKATGCTRVRVSITKAYPRHGCSILITGCSFALFSCARVLSLIVPDSLIVVGSKPLDIIRNGMVLIRESLLI